MSGVPRDTYQLIDLQVDQAKEIVAVVNGVFSANDLFAQGKEDLALPSLRTLTPPVARILATCKKPLCLSGLTELSDETAKALAQHRGTLSLNGFPTLSDGAAKALAQHLGTLSLNGLTTLSDGAAKALAQHLGTLSLDRLTTLSDGAAKALALHQGDLCLRGLTALSDEQSESLAQHKGRMTLTGLTTLSGKAAFVLSRRSSLSDSLMRAISERAVREQEKLCWTKKYALAQTRQTSCFLFFRIANGCFAVLAALLCAFLGIAFLSQSSGDATGLGFGFLLGGPLGATVEFAAVRMLIDVADVVVAQATTAYGKTP